MVLGDPSHISDLARTGTHARALSSANCLAGVFGRARRIWCLLSHLVLVNARAMGHRARPDRRGVGHRLLSRSIMKLQPQRLGQLFS